MRPETTTNEFRNVRATYAAIGQASPNAEVFETEHFLACRSPLRQPTSNFAVVESIDEETLSTVRKFAENQRLFYLYSYLPDNESPDEERMARFGFRHATLLHCMAGGEPTDSSTNRLAKVEDYETRLAITRFMSLQFFSSQPQEVRDAVSCATASATMPLWKLSIDEEIIGAAMSHELFGVYGIYNVCVASNLRSRGYGTEILNALLNEAKRTNCIAALQCDRRLLSFYEGFGMKTTGIVDVWSLDR